MTLEPIPEEALEERPSLRLTPEMVDLARTHWLNVWDLGKTLPPTEDPRVVEAAQMLACASLFLTFCKKLDTSPGAVLSVAQGFLGNDKPPSEALH